MGGDINCLMVSGMGLTDLMRDILLDTARQMVHDGKKRRSIRNDDFDGLITTNNESVVMDTIAGVVFEAELEVGPKRVKARYLVNHNDLDHGNHKWKKVRFI